MPEVQLHGFDFENWIKKTFFADFSISYSHKWDIPAEFNRLEIIPEAFPLTKMILNPKIDSKSQRRLQCSLPFGVFWNDFVRKESYRNTECALFGERVPNPFVCGARVFKPKLD